jgi:uncharacterized protein (TIGR03437 family)
MRKSWGLVVAAMLAFSTPAAAQQEFAYPVSAQIQSVVPPGGIAAENFYLPSSASLGCFEGTRNGNRYLCLNDTGQVLVWTADGRIRTFAEGFTGPLQAVASDDGTLFVLDEGRATLTLITPEGQATRVMGSGSDRIIRAQMDPKTFDLPYFALTRDAFVNHLRLAAAPDGSLYLGITRQETTIESGATSVRRFFYVLRMDKAATTLGLYWNGSAQLPAQQELPVLRAISVDGAQNFFFSLDGQLSQLTQSLQYRLHQGGRFTLLNSNPVRKIVQAGNGNIFLHANSGNLMRLAFFELRTDLDIFNSLDGQITRQGADLFGFDGRQNRLLKYVPDTARIFAPEVAARLLRFLPVTGNNAFRAAFDDPQNVSIDRNGQIFVVEGADGSLYRISNNGTVDRVGRSIYNPDAPPPANPFPSDQVRMDSFPFPLVATGQDSEGRLHILDRQCNFFVQTDSGIARRVARLTADRGCRSARIVVDQNRRAHVSVEDQGEIYSGTGEISAGEWTFTRIYSGLPLLSLSMLVGGDLLLVEGNSAGIWAMKRINISTRAVTTLALDEALRNQYNMRISSAVSDFSGKIIAVSCCTAGSSRESNRRFLATLNLSGTNQLSGTARNIVFFNGAGESPETVFTHPRGVVIKTSANRIYYFEDAIFRADAAVSLPRSQTWTYDPSGGLQELSIPTFPTFGPTAFRTRMTCTNGFEKFVRLGPSAAVSPTPLRLGLDTLNAPPANASCTIELGAIDSSRVLASTTVSLVPDPEQLAKIPVFTVLEKITPFSISPSAASATRSVRVVNNLAETRRFRLAGRLPEGIMVTPEELTLESKQTGEFVLTITPEKLFRQNYQIPLNVSCAGCELSVALDLSFQLRGRATAIELSSDAVLVDMGALNARGSARVSATTLVLTNLDETDVAIRPDFGTGAKWFSMQKSASWRTEDGRLVVTYDVVVDRQALLARTASTIVTFESATTSGLARRFLTAFYFPEGTTAERVLEAGEAGSTVDLATATTAKVTIPVFSRAPGALSYTTYTIGAGTESVTVAPAQGIAGRGRTDIELTAQKTATPTTPSELKNVVVQFSNGEKLIYTLNVVTQTQRAAADIGGRKSAGGPRDAGACASARLLIAQREPGLPFTVVRNVGLRFRYELKDECGQLLNASDQTQLRFALEPANGTVTTTSVGNGIWEVFWKPERNGENIPVRLVAVRGVSEREIYVGTLNLSGRVADSTVPSLRAFSVLDGASFQEKRITAPGAYITIFGENLAEEPLLGTSNPAELPTELGGLQVQFNGKPAPLLYVSKTQLNLQVPFDLESSEYRLVVKRGELTSTPSGIGVGVASPGIFTVNSTGSGQGLIYKFNSSGAAIADTANPAAPGDGLLIFAAGLGSTNPLYAEGKAVPLTDALPIISPVQVFLGEVPARDAQAILAPGLIGVYRVTAFVPEDAPRGEAVPLIVRASGVDSQIVTLAIQ